MAFYYDDQLYGEENTIKLFGGDGYTEEIARAIYSEDFEFEIANTWSDFNSGNPLEAGWETLKSHFSGYMPLATDIAKSLRDNKTFDASKGGLMKLGSALTNFVADGRAQQYLNKALVVQGTRFIYYSGTNVSMGNMQLKYTVMYDPVENKTVQDQIKKILPYAIGDYKSLTDSSSNSDSNSFKDELGTLIGWQDPPGTPAYEANYKNIDSVHKGTLKLEFGADQFSIDNLVVAGMTVVASRATVKPKSSDGKATPLYADISLTFKPAGIITKNKLMEYLRISK